MPNPWVFIRCDQLKVVNKKEQLEKGLEVEEEKKHKILSSRSLGNLAVCNML
jgi:hypothetical protein